VANHSVVNLTEVENQGPNFGLDPNNMELRMARVPLEMQNAGISLLKLGPGWRASHGHTHNKQEETYVCVAGSARMNVDGEIVEMTPYVAVRVSPQGMRSYEAGPEGATLIAVGAPNTGPGDGTITQGWWVD
jgi:mannose-6-phosphate isomerase-like protein (cupin superfamily)